MEIYNNEKKNVSAKRKPVVIVAVMIAAVILLNIGLQFLPDGIRRFDITDAKSYTLSDETKEYLSSIDETVTLYVLDADGSDIKFEYWLQRLDGAAHSVEVKWTSTTRVEDKLTELGITLEQTSPYILIVESEKRSIAMGYADLISYRTSNSTLTSYLGANEMTAAQYNSLLTTFANYAYSSSEYASQYAEMVDVLLNDVEKYFNAEPYLCRMVEYVTVDIIPARYTLTGHGETELSKTEMGYYLSDGVGITHKSLNLSETDIPEDAVSIFVVNPTADISEAEAQKLISFLDGGGQMTFFTSEANLDMLNLTSVLGAYGLSAEKGAVGEIVKVEIDGEGTEESSEPPKTEEIYRTDVSVEINTDHRAMESIKEANAELSPVITNGNSIIYSNKDGFTLTPIFTTSPSAYIGEDKTDLQARSVAAVSEKAGGGTLLWFTGADSFTTPILESTEDTALTRTLYSNIYVVVSSLSLAPFTYESTVTVPDAKYYGERLMSVNETSYVVYAALIAVLVVASCVFGVVFLYKRKKS